MIDAVVRHSLPGCLEMVIYTSLDMAVGGGSGLIDTPNDEVDSVCL